MAGTCSKSGCARRCGHLAAVVRSLGQSWISQSEKKNQQTNMQRSCNNSEILIKQFISGASIKENVDEECPCK